MGLCERQQSHEILTERKLLLPTDVIAILTRTLQCGTHICGGVAVSKLSVVHTV